MARDRKRAKQRRARARPDRARADREPKASGDQPLAEPQPGLLKSSLERAVPAEFPGSDRPAPPVRPVDEVADEGAEVFADELGEEPSEQEVVPAGARRQAAQPIQQHRSGNRVFAFLRASWAELQRVQWPDRRQVAQATAVVMGFVIIAGAYLGLADLAAQKIVDAVL